ncbi:MAG: GHMP kinase [Bacteroidetes bacterium]|nr:GHMP kinase [Bacteroidota bacterium]
MVIKTQAYPRAALIGNPSDGYYGKTIAFVFKNFRAEVELTPSDKLHIIPCGRERLLFYDIDDLADEISSNGYYGGTRLIKATIKVLHQYCTQHNIEIPIKNFTLSYDSNIPGRLGLAGSSAIITAAINALLQFYDIEIPKPVLANIILSAEKDELHIGAGLQDRVAQVYATPVYMNFDKELMDKQGYGDYIPFDKSLLPNLYLAYRTNLSEGSEVMHNDLAARYKKGDAEVLRAIEQWRQLTDAVWHKLKHGDKDIAALINQNFDIRNNTIAISKGNKQLVETARAVGASAKFTGSGGAIIGTYQDEHMFQQLSTAMHSIGAEVIKPDIA